jgi:hypothetical protein
MAQSLVPDEVNIMKYLELKADAPQNRYADTHPFLAAIHIRGIQWHAFKDMLDDDDVAKLISARPDSGRMLAYVATLDEEVADRLEDAWSD